MKDNVLAPILRENYIAYNNSLRMCVRELGIHKAADEKTLDLTRYLQERGEDEKIRGKWE
jgi:hypothetical protein